MPPASLVLGPVLRHVGPADATVWVETDRRCTVEVLGHRSRSFEVSGHHYALLVIGGLEPGASVEYAVHLDGHQVWPEAGAALPPSRIRTPDPQRPVRVTFGSCRVASRRAVDPSDGFGVDALEAFAVRLAGAPDHAWPDLLLMLGDQVYADGTTAATRRRIAARRSLTQPPGPDVADFEEYTWLYHESWSDPEIRWLLSTVPVAMIFDDHDVSDDWNISRGWRSDVQATSWWPERIVGALASYWVYQHLGNLSPGDLDADPVWQQVRACAETGTDAAPVLRALAQAADREADGGSGYRWSFRWDLGDTRLVVVDSRCGRMLAAGARAMLSEREFAWVEQGLAGDYRHLLLGTSVPWLLSPLLHAVETWNERLSEHHGRRRARFGEALRRVLDLEHWAAFRASFERLTALLADVGRGDHAPGGRPPATISVLSGDVHHSYLCEADLRAAGTRAGEPVPARVHQVTCSPMHNRVPTVMLWGFGAAWDRRVDRMLRPLLERVLRLPRPGMAWWPVAPPVYGNVIATMVLAGEEARVVLEAGDPDPERPLRPVLARSV